MKKMIESNDLRLWLSVIGIALLCILGFFSDQIAGKGKWIDFDPHEIAKEAAAYQAPGVSITDADLGRERIHRLGTDQLGRDVASRLVHGTSVAIKVGVFSSLISLLIALLLGGVAGYYGDHTHRASILQLGLFLLGILLVHYYASELAYVMSASSQLSWSLWKYLACMVVGIGILLALIRLLGFIKVPEIKIRWDAMVVKLMEVFKSVPRLFLLLAVFAIITRPSVLAVIIIIGCIRWPNLTRIIRAEILKVKEESFIHNAKLLGIFFTYRPSIIRGKLGPYDQ